MTRGITPGVQSAAALRRAVLQRARSRRSEQPAVHRQRVVHAVDEEDRHARHQGRRRVLPQHAHRRQLAERDQLRLPDRLSGRRNNRPVYDASGVPDSGVHAGRLARAELAADDRRAGQHQHDVALPAGSLDRDAAPDRSISARGSRWSAATPPATSSPSTRRRSCRGSAATYDLEGNGKTVLQASYGHYSGKYSEAQFAANTDVGNPSRVTYGYTGPAGSGRDFAPAFDLANYGTIISAAFPTANIFVADGLHSPTVREFTTSVGRELGTRGFAQGDLSVPPLVRLRRGHHRHDDRRRERQPQRRQHRQPVESRSTTTPTASTASTRR